MVTLATVWGDLGSLRRHFGKIGVTLASLWGALGGPKGPERPIPDSEQVRGECKESARRVQGECREGASIGRKVI